MVNNMAATWKTVRSKLNINAEDEAIIMLEKDCPNSRKNPLTNPLRYGILISVRQPVLGIRRLQPMLSAGDYNFQEDIT